MSKEQEEKINERIEKLENEIQNLKRQLNCYNENLLPHYYSDALIQSESDRLRQSLSNNICGISNFQCILDHNLLNDYLI